ncbi:hypothetical protein J4G02_10025 [Candidatus Poribacteria bacterium]|nr:hypothetical protein [Candidatus Poribacteria bacterium]
MDHKQKLGYTVLGAVIMLVGIGVGSIVSPPLIAQRDGVFGEIECTELIVVDKAGKTAVHLSAREDGNGIAVYDTAGQKAITLTAVELGNSVTVCDKAGKAVVDLIAIEAGKGAVVAYDKAGNIRGVAP